jgi:aspartate aminotransferase
MRVSSIRKLTSYSDAAKKKGKKVYHLNIGQPDLETPLSYYDYIRKYNDKVIAYMPSEGVYELRDEIAKYYKKFKADFTADDVIITTGGTEGFMFSLMSITNPSDEILLTEPYYSNYNVVLNECKVNPTPVLTKVDNNFRFTKEDLENKITEKTQIILVTNPGNPTGAVLSDDEINAICEVAIENDLYIISDEVYREIVFDGRKTFSFGSRKDIEDRLIIIDSISKRFSACGARIGMAITKNSKIKKLLIKLCQGRLAVSTIEQQGAIGLYKFAKDMPEFVRDEFEKRRNLAYEILSKEKDIICSKSEGAFYDIIKIPIPNAEEFLIWMLEDFEVDGETVMAAPASGFYATKGHGKNEIRIAYVLEEKKLKRALEILLKGLRIYSERINNE